MENNDPYEIQLLSQLVNNVEGMMDLQVNDDFKHALVMFGHFIDQYIIAPYKGEIFVQTQLLSKRKEAEKPDMGDTNKPEDKKKPKETIEKTATARTAERAIDDVDFVRIEIGHDWRAPTPLVQVGTIAQGAVADG